MGGPFRGTFFIVSKCFQAPFFFGFEVFDMPHVLQMRFRCAFDSVRFLGFVGTSHDYLFLAFRDHLVPCCIQAQIWGGRKGNATTVKQHVHKWKRKRSEAIPVLL